MDPSWASQLEPPGADGSPSFVPLSSAAYTSRGYWNHRFSAEQSYDWLCRYAAVRPLLRGYCTALRPAREARVLLVGNGNSSLAVDMAADGFGALTASDYSPVVVAAMAARCANGDGDCSGDGGGDGSGGSDDSGGSGSGVDATARHTDAPARSIRWVVADMRDLRGFADASLDAVVDKAAMDAVLADGGDVWPGEAPPELLATARDILAAAARVLAPGGVYLQLTFSQPHFRRQYLAQAPELWASLTPHALDVGLGLTLWAAVRAGAREEGGKGEGEGERQDDGKRQGGTVEEEPARGGRAASEGAGGGGGGGEGLEAG